MSAYLPDIDNISSISSKVYRSVVKENGVNTIIGSIDRNYGSLSYILMNIVESLTAGAKREPRIRWRYAFDADTGLEVLRTQKNPEALDRMRKIADELFE